MAAGDSDAAERSKLRFAAALDAVAQHFTCPAAVPFLRALRRSSRTRSLEELASLAGRSPFGDTIVVDASAQVQHLFASKVSPTKQNSQPLPTTATSRNPAGTDGSQQRHNTVMGELNEVRVLAAAAHGNPVLQQPLVTCTLSEMQELPAVERLRWDEAQRRWHAEPALQFALDVVVNRSCPTAVHVRLLFDNEGASKDAPVQCGEFTVSVSGGSATTHTDDRVAAMALESSHAVERRFVAIEDARPWWFATGAESDAIAPAAHLNVASRAVLPLDPSQGSRFAYASSPPLALPFRRCLAPLSDEVAAQCLKRFHLLKRQSDADESLMEEDVMPMPVNIAYPFSIDHAAMLQFNLNLFAIDTAALASPAQAAYAMFHPGGGLILVIVAEGGDSSNEATLVSFSDADSVTEATALLLPSVESSAGARTDGLELIIFAEDACSLLLAESVVFHAASDGLGLPADEAAYEE
jgi:hypothetical protein